VLNKNKRKWFSCGQKPPFGHMTHGGSRRSMLRQKMSPMTVSSVEMRCFVALSLLSPCVSN